MKIAFVISSINSKSHGGGGHYYSLIETVAQLSLLHEVIIYNVGNHKSIALEKSVLEVQNIVYKDISVFKIYKGLNRALKEFEPEVIHAFDNLALLWVRTIGRLKKIPFCVTKCGGVNPRYFPFSQSLILFSNENLVFFKDKKKFKKSKLYLIPNRIRSFKDDEERIASITTQIKDEHQQAIKFLRISRISSYYHKGALQLIALIKKLRSDGLNCILIFVGTVEDTSCFSELRKASKGFGYFFTEQYYTTNAKTLINSANVVLGTGRSMMEAASKEKVLLVPTKNFTIPSLLYQDNFKAAFNLNFSERYSNHHQTERENYQQILSTLKSQKNIEALNNFSMNVFENYFDSSKIEIQYIKVYQELTNRPPLRFIDYILHLLFVLRAIYK